LLLAVSLLLSISLLLSGVAITWLWRRRLLLQRRQLDVDSSFVLFQPPIIATLGAQLFDGGLDLWDVVLAVVALPDNDVNIGHSSLASFLERLAQDSPYLIDTLTVQVDLIRLD
jgi:hypothetical protein